MLSFLLKRFSGRHYKKFLEKARPTVVRINELEKEYQALTDEQLRAKTDEFRARQASFLSATQNPDGGFSGREGGSDLYYAGFALRGLAVLGDLTPEIAERATGGREDELLDSCDVFAPEALPDRAVLAVDRP